MFQQKQLLSSSVRQCRVMEAEFIKKTSTKFNFHHFLIAVELKMTEVCVKTFFFKLKSVVVFLKFLTFMPLSRPDGKTLVKTLSLFASLPNGPIFTFTLACRTGGLAGSSAMREASAKREPRKIRL